MISWDADTDIPVNLTAIKSLLRISTEIHDDDILDVLLPAAVEWAEGVMHRSILAKTHRWTLPCFPDYGAIVLPRGKTQSVMKIEYSANGTIYTLRGPSSGSPIGTDYQEDLSWDTGGIILPARGAVWPTPDYNVPAPVTITYVAGWTLATVPSEIKRALIRYIGDELDVPTAADLTQYTDLSAKDIMLSAWTLRCA